MTDFLLIHGAYQGGWIWRPVADRLRAKGHRVFTPTLDGCGERAGSLRAGITTETHGHDIAQLLRFEDLSDAVLVGTSSGGMVMARAAEEARDRVARVVFADALALMDGERIRDIVTRPARIEQELAIGPNFTDAHDRLLVDLAPEERRWTAERFTLHPRACFYEPVKLPSFWSQDWQATVLYCDQAENPGEAHQRRAQEALGASWHVLSTGHYPMLSTPDALTEIILNG